MASNKTIKAVEASYKIIYTGEMDPPNPGQWVLMLVDTSQLKTVSIPSADVNTTSNKIIISNHRLITGVEGRFTTTGTLPAPLAANTDYWIIRIDNNEFRVASSLENARNGTAITLTTAGNGTHTFSQNMVNSNSNIEQFVSIEVPDENGYERLQVLFPTGLSFQSGPNKVSTTVDIEFSASGGNIDFDGVILLADASIDYGDTSGYVWTTSDQDPRTIVEDTSFLIKVNAQTLTVSPSTTGLV